MFVLYIQSVLPVLMSTQASASWVCGPTTIVLFSPSPTATSPVRVHAYNLPFITTGLDIPATSLFTQATLLPLKGSHSSGNPVSFDLPFCSGPRQLVQSLPRMGRMIRLNMKVQKRG